MKTIREQVLENARYHQKVAAGLGVDSRELRQGQRELHEAIGRIAEQLRTLHGELRTRPRAEPRERADSDREAARAREIDAHLQELKAAFIAGLRSVRERMSEGFEELASNAESTSGVGAIVTSPDASSQYAKDIAGLRDQIAALAIDVRAVVERATSGPAEGVASTTAVEPTPTSAPKIAIDDVQSMIDNLITS